MKLPEGITATTGRVRPGAIDVKITIDVSRFTAACDTAATALRSMRDQARARRWLIDNDPDRGPERRARARMAPAWMAGVSAAEFADGLERVGRVMTAGPDEIAELAEKIQAQAKEQRPRQTGSLR
jgi:hypothetical protein